MVAFNTRNGKRMWSTPLSFAVGGTWDGAPTLQSSPLVEHKPDGNVFAAYGDTLLALHPQNGHVHWSWSFCAERFNITWVGSKPPSHNEACAPYTATTPVLSVDSAKVWRVLFALHAPGQRTLLVALNLEGGRGLWIHSFNHLSPPHFSTQSSLLTFGSHCFLALGGRGGPLMAINVRHGALAWMASLPSTGVAPTLTADRLSVIYPCMVPIPGGKRDPMRNYSDICAAYVSNGSVWWQVGGLSCATDQGGFNCTATAPVTSTADGMLLVTIGDSSVAHNQWGELVLYPKPTKLSLSHNVSRVNFVTPHWIWNGFRGQGLSGGGEAVLGMIAHQRTVGGMEAPATGPIFVSDLHGTLYRLQVSNDTTTTPTTTSSSTTTTSSTTTHSTTSSSTTSTSTESTTSHTTSSTSSTSSSSGDSTTTHSITSSSSSYSSTGGVVPVSSAPMTHEPSMEGLVLLLVVIIVSVLVFAVATGIAVFSLLRGASIESGKDSITSGNLGSL